MEWAAREAALRSVPLRIVSAASLPKMVALELRPEREAALGFVRDYRDRALADAAARAPSGVGVGDLDDCDAALAFAFEEAALRKASLLAVHAWQAPQDGTVWAGGRFPPPGLHVAASAAARRLTALMDMWREKYPEVPASEDVMHAHPGRALADLSASAGLVVIGRHSSHSGLQGLGSVRHAVLHHAHGAIAIVPSS